MRKLSPIETWTIDVLNMASQENYDDVRWRLQEVLQAILHFGYPQGNGQEDELHFFDTSYDTDLSRAIIHEVNNFVSYLIDKQHIELKDVCGVKKHKLSRKITITEAELDDETFLNVCVIERCRDIAESINNRTINAYLDMFHLLDVDFREGQLCIKRQFPNFLLGYDLNLMVAVLHELMFDIKILEDSGKIKLLPIAGSHSAEVFSNREDNSSKHICCSYTLTTEVTNNIKKALNTSVLLKI